MRPRLTKAEMKTGSSKMLVFTLIGLSLAFAIALVYGTIRWQSGTQALRTALDTARRPTQPKTYNAQEIQGLPEPVQRYFRTALKDGQPIVSAVKLEQTGTMNMSESGEQWSPFSANQRVITRQPGFDWEARIAIMHVLPVWVHDAYVAREGILHASLFGLLPLANLRGTPEAARGELLRFLAEAAWYPTALLPSQGIQWDAVSETSAKATLIDGPTTAVLLFRFNEDGLIESVRADSRGRMQAGTVMPTPWEGRWSDYALHDGMRIPQQGEVAWIFADGAKTYWRGRVTALHYEFDANRD